LTFDFISKTKREGKKTLKSIATDEEAESKLHELPAAEPNEDREDLISWGPSDGKVESCNRAGMIYCFAAALALDFFFRGAWKKMAKKR
jgi:hypothetical protein